MHLNDLDGKQGIQSSVVPHEMMKMQDFY